MKTMQLDGRLSIFLLVIAYLLSACQGLGRVQISPVPAATGALPETSGTAYIKVKDQRIIDGLVMIDEAFSSGPGWVVIYDDHSGRVGDFIGWMPVNSGLNRNFPVSVNTGHMAGKTVEKFYAILHVDAGYVGVPEFPSKDVPDGPDVAVKVDNQVVMAVFQDLAAVAAVTVPAGTPPVGEGVRETPVPTAGMVHGPAQTFEPGALPMIRVDDQDVQNGMVTVAEAFSVGPGWAVIYSAGPDGQPADKIGFASLLDGDNHDVLVQVDGEKITPRLYAILHQDTATIGTFEYPQADPPVHIEVRMVQAVFNSKGQLAALTTPVSQATPEEQAAPTEQSAPTEQAAPVESATPQAPGTPGSGTNEPMVVADDQPVRGGAVIITDVYSDGPGWIGVHISNPDGSLSPAAIGAGRVNPGGNHAVIVRLTRPERATPILYAMLHIDSGIVGEYEFPDPAIDVPVKAHDMEVMDPFTVTMGLAGQLVTVNTADGGGIPHLVDAQGFSLYVQSSGNCSSKECQDSWLPLIATGKLTPGDGVAASKLGVMSLGDGRRQVTYGNLPLYYFARDIYPGDIGGQGLDGVWFLARP